MVSTRIGGRLGAVALATMLCLAPEMTPRAARASAPPGSTGTEMATMRSGSRLAGKQAVGKAGTRAIPGARAPVDTFEAFWKIRSDGKPIRSYAGVSGLVYMPFYFEIPDVGFDVYAVLRPSAAKAFYPSFERYNIGLLASLTYIEFAYTRRVVDGSVTFRQYIRRLNTRPSEDGAFFGVGIGIVGIAWHQRDIEYRNWSLRAELGYEFRAVANAVVSVRLEGRRMKAGPVNLNGAGVAITVGWKTD